MNRRSHHSIKADRPRRSGDRLRPKKTGAGCRKHPDQRLALTLAVSQILAESPDLDHVVPRILETIGHTLRWHTGAFWLLNEAGLSLRCIACWRGPNFRLTGFEKDSLSRQFPLGIGLPGRVWATLQPLWIPNVSGDSNFPRGGIAGTENLHGAFAFPILSGSRFLGVMEFFSREIREPDQPLLTMVATIGGQIGQFLERKSVEKALQTYLTEQQLLFHLVQAVNQARALPEIYEAALDAITQGSGCDRSSILFFDESKVMRFKAWRGLSDGYREAVEGHSPWKPDERDPLPIFIEDAGQLDPHLRAVVEGEGIRALGFIPITYESALLGKFMVYFNNPHRCDPRVTRLSQAIASQVAFAVQRRRSQEQLELLVRERTAKLREMIGELQHVSYAITHDMRAPLRAMNAFATLILEEISAMGNGSAQLLDACRRMVTSAARLDRLIQDSLSYTKSVLQEVPLRAVDLSVLVPSLIETYPNLHPDKAQIQIETKLPRVLGDESLLTQCFSNLLGNAVKFVSPGIRPQIVIHSQQDAESVRITVQDNGIGIPRAAHQRLFGMFQRLTDGYEGTGIGLAIVRKVVERMGGMVGAESEPGKGSRFWVMLRTADAGNPPRLSA